MNKRVIIVMGVSGSGKTTIGSRLAARLGIPFLDADDYHPETNIRKMGSGIPLDDEDRKPWLEGLSRLLAVHGTSTGAVLACSALKEQYRKILSSQVENMIWVFLQGEFALVMERMQQREDHYMPPALLRSQFDDLEKPKYDIKVDITSDPVVITENILAKLTPDRKSAFGVIGLGVMGTNISFNMAEKGIALSAYNRGDQGEIALLDGFVSGLDPDMDVIGYTDLESFVKSLERPRKILLLVKAGEATDTVLLQLMPFLQTGDIVVDGGNAHFVHTERRQEELSKSGIHLVGCGISGGEKGARNGPSLMPGGNSEAYTEISGVLESIAGRDDKGQPCCTYIGPGGAGHFVKMVHNGIEYAEMQLIAEAYHLLSSQLPNPDMADLFDQWNKGDLASYLLEITARILRRKEGEAWLLDRILDEAGNKGTGSWSVNAALDLGSVNSMMGAAVFARYRSSDPIRRRVGLQPGRPGNPEQVAGADGIDPNVLENAFRFARIINHHQGFELLRHASSSFRWDLDLADISRIWTNGCIIRSALMQQCVSWFADAETLLDSRVVKDQLCSHEPDVASILGHGVKNRIPLPAFSAAWNDWVSITAEKLPANLIQAQRDFFGAHTYHRKDDPDGKSYHTNWEADD